MEKVQTSHAGGISMIAFVVALGVSLGYYQFVYVPEANKRPIVPEEILNPAGKVDVKIVPGSSLDTNGKFFVPVEVRGVLGLSNKVVWNNTDTVAHTVTSDNNYVDKINGPFDSLQQQEKLPGGFLKEGQTFDFTFTQAGEYPYHCVPHPHMTGVVTIVENFA
ncbi:MAG: cupredoxin domain-containing protein, partial [Nitrososphaerales archaeon]